MALIPKFFKDSVLSIGMRTPAGLKWVGTGFMIIRKVDESHYQPYLVTNKHVLEGQKTIVLRLKKASGSLITIDVHTVNQDGPVYSGHPHPDVDVAVMTLIGSFFEQNDIPFFGIDIDEHALASADFVEQGGGEGSYVFMLGYPMGLVDVESTTPICRGGCVARVDAQEIARSKNMLLDIQNFPGNAGSPVVTKPELISIEGTEAIAKSVLIGIVNSYITYSEDLISLQSNRIVEVRTENSGIARCIPVEFIREAVDIEAERVRRNSEN